jgi:hypothetical protein
MLINIAYLLYQILVHMLLNIDNLMLMIMINSYRVVIATDLIGLAPSKTVLINDTISW